MSASPITRPAPSGPLQTALRGARRLAEALATPLVPEDYLDLFDPMRAGADLRGRIVDIRPETPGAATITIEPGKSWNGHTPGQYIRIGVDINGVRHWRAYSLTHRGDGQTISITTKAIPDGLVSNFLVHRARPGTLVHLDQATGDFVLPQPAPAKTLFLTAGSGITPIMGMLRNQLADLPDVVHLHCAPSAGDAIFSDELHQYAAQGRMTYVERLDDRDGFLNVPRDLDTLVPDWRDRLTWVCGPTGLLDDAEAFWAEHELADHLHAERFRTTLVEPGEGGEVTFLDTDLTVDADGGTTILDAGEEAGVLMPSGCRMGICFGCVATMRRGSVRDLRTGDITTAEPGEEVSIQTCVNAVAGSCDIEL